jgi:hypothetical protein
MTRVRRIAWRDAMTRGLVGTIGAIAVALALLVTVTQRARGVVKGKRCIAPPKHLPKHGKKPRKCTRTLVLGTFTHREKAGTNTVKFGGEVKRHPLEPASYTLQAVATAAGKKSRTVGTRFTVLGCGAWGRVGYSACCARSSSPSRSRSASWPSSPIVKRPAKMATASIDLRPCWSQ